MITFMLLFIAAVIFVLAAIVTVAVFGIAGGALIFVIADVMIAICLIYMIIKGIFGKKN